MKNSVVRMSIRICFMLLIAISTAHAAEVYVSARISPLFQEPATASQRLAETLNRGDRLVHIDSQDGFLLVALQNGTEGWVPERFISFVQPEQTEQPELADLESRTNRRRANSYTTSAAAARGLQDDSARSRENVAFTDYDLRAAEWLHSVTRILDREVLDFAKRHEIGF